MTTLQTERLTLRPLAPGDAEAYAAMRYHPKVARWLPPPPVEPAEAVRNSIERFAAGWRERGYAPWGIFRAGQLIGHGGLNYVPEFGETEVLWALHPRAWGRGYATETARAMIDYAFGKLGHEVLHSGARVSNSASRRVLEKCGFQWTGVQLCRIRAINSAAPIDRFRLDRRLWASLKAWGRERQVA